MNVFDHFDQIWIINLPERSDRRRGMDRQLREYNLKDNPRVSYFDAFRPADAGSFASVGARGCYQSHKALLKKAASDGSSILILEDDCLFYPEAISRDVSSGWDIFYGGFTAVDPSDVERSNIEGAHMMGFSARGARLVSEYLENLTCEGIHPPIDAAYVWFRRASPDVPTMFASPQMAGQRASRSDIADLAWYDRLPIVREASNVLRSMR
jgi:glycosyl transferase, family 25